MSNYAVEASHVWKKFRRGELHDSLRDFVPAAVRSLMRKSRPNLALAQNEFWVLRNVSFALAHGEAMGIIGPNGAGKSTMLKLLTRIIRPTRGRLAVRGRLGALIEISAGFHPDLTGRENIFLNGAILGMRRQQIERKLDAIVDFSGIEEFIDTPTKRYSSGMQARLGFAVASNMDPEVLLVDEVLSVGDAAFRAKCIQRMESLIRSGVSVIFVSHQLEQVRRLCDSCMVLSHGEMHFHGSAEMACEKYMELLDPTRIKPVSHELGKLNDLSFRHADGTPFRQYSSVAPGTRVVVEGTFDLAESFEEYSAIVFLLDLSVERVVGDYQHQFSNYENLGNRVRIRCELNLDCTRGDYSLELLLYHRSTDTRVIRQEFIRFSVSESVSARGPVWLSPKFQVVDPSGVCAARAAEHS